jgi:DNA-binding transcriptional LysR family regulator
MTAASYAAACHIFVSRRMPERGRIDDILEKIGIARDIATPVDGLSAALALARATDLVITLPERYTAGFAKGLIRFPLPFKAPEIAISMLWHPKQDSDPAHRWLRGVVREVCDS